MDDIASNSIEDLEWIARATDKSGDFIAVYDRYFPRVYTYICYRVGDPAVSDDLAAQVFERALKSMEKYRPEQGPFAAWLFAIARNSVNDYLRSQRRHPHIPLDALRFQPNPETQTEEQVVQNETVAEILVAMSQLNERERELLSLKFASGLTNRHIARITRLGEKNVGVILYRAIRRLRDCLETKE